MQGDTKRQYSNPAKKLFCFRNSWKSAVKSRAIQAKNAREFQPKPVLHNEYVEFPGCNFYYIPIWKFTLRKSKLRNPRLSFYDKSNVITKNLT